MRFAWLDTAYPEALASIGGTTAPYEQLFHSCFGTADAWDLALRSRGHDSSTYYAEKETDIYRHCRDADAVCVQNVGRFPGLVLRQRFGKSKKLIGFCSYATDLSNVMPFDITFSSFKWFVEEINARGGRAVWLPLAFQRAVLDRVTPPPSRNLPLTFVGGLGSIWESGTAVMARVAEEFPTEFTWRGYRVGTLPNSLERTYRGHAWGHEYYRTLMRSKITLNRHGEIARGEMNCMRTYEALGCGAFMFTDGQRTAVDIFPVERDDLVPFFLYDDVENLCVQLRAAMCDHFDKKREEVAAYGHEVVMRDHCYENRVDAFLEAVNAL